MITTPKDSIKVALILFVFAGLGLAYVVSHTTPSPVSVIQDFPAGNTQTASISGADSGLVAHYTFDDGTATDSSGNGNHGTLTNGPTPTTGKVGSGALQFDGTDDYVTSQTVTFGSKMSFSFWIKTNATAGTFMSWRHTRFCALGSGATANKLICTVDADLSGGSRTTSVINDDKWHHIAYLVDGNEQYIYVDGVQEDILRSETLDTTSGTIIAGKREFGGYGRANMDDVRVYNRTLTATEVSELYNLGSDVSLPPTDVDNPNLPPVVDTPTVPNNGNWYVDKDSQCAPSCDGTSWTKAWNSFASIDWTKIKPGHSLFISGGNTSKIYTEAWSVKSSGTQNAPISIRVGQDAGHNGKVIFDYNGLGDYADTTGIRLIYPWIIFDGEVNGSSHWEFRNLRNITNKTTAYSMGGYDATGLEIKFLTFTNVNHGMRFHSTNYAKIHHNIFRQVRGDAAITIFGNIQEFDSTLIYNNDIELVFNNIPPPEKSTVLYSGPDGIQASHGVSIFKNIIRVVKNPNIYTSTQHPDSLQITGRKMKVYNNEFINVGDSAIDFDAYGQSVVSDVWIYNNVFRIIESIDPYPEYIRLYRSGTGSLSEMSNVKVMNNTFIDNPWTNVGLGRVWTSVPGTGNEFRNNIFYNSGDGSYRILFGVGNVNSWTLSNNIYYNDVPSKMYVSFGGVVHNISDWISLGIDKNSSTDKPKFVKYGPNQSDNNLKLMGTDVSAVDKGVNLSSYFNFDNVNNLRNINNAWDIGAYEYYSGQPTTPPTTPVTPPTGGGTPSTPSTPSSPTTPSTPSGGGTPSITTPSGGGGTPSVSITTSPVSLSAQAGQPSSPYSFTRHLTVGSTGNDVKVLQQTLNSLGYTVSFSGAGSLGNETTYYGPATTLAIQKFQCAVLKICSGSPYTNGYGNFGPATRAAMSARSGGGSITATNQSTSTFSQLQTPSIAPFTRSLRLGMTGNDVKALQVFLNTKGFTVSTTGPGSKGLETTYFGPATARAVSAFQEAYISEILTPNGLTRGTGYFGVSTMRKVNGLLEM